MTSQHIALHRTFFSANQEILYTEENSTEVVTIVEVHNMDGKAQTIYTINFKGGLQFNTEEIHPSQLPEDNQNEIALQ